MGEPGTRAGIWGPKCDTTPLDALNQRRFAVWALAWSISFVVATLILEGEWLPAGPLPWLVAIVPTLLGAGVVRSYVAFLRQADELMRRIHMESLAWGFGSGMLFMMSYRLLERAGAPDLDMNDPLLVMLLVWAVAQVIISRRYR